MYNSEPNRSIFEELLHAYMPCNIIRNFQGVIKAYTFMKKAKYKRKMWNIDEMQYSSNFQKNKETVLYVILPINPKTTMLQGSSQ